MFTGGPGRWSSIYTYAGREKKSIDPLQRKNGVMHKKNGTRINGKRIEMREASAVERT